MKAGRGIGKEEAVPDDQQFDRRKRDINVEDLADRVTGLERLTGQVHEAVFGKADEIGVFGQTQQLHAAVFGREGEEQEGMRAKVKEVHDVFTDAKRGFAMLNKIADTVTRWGKPILFVLGIGSALGVLFKTGEWKWPPW